MYIIDVFKELKLKIEKSEKKSRPLESFISFAFTQRKWLEKVKWPQMATTEPRGLRVFKKLEGVR